MAQMQPGAAALAGIRVLDLSTNHAAYAGRLLADLGAEVVRVEPPDGSPVRTLAPLTRAPDGEDVQLRARLPRCRQAQRHARSRFGRRPRALRRACGGKRRGDRDAGSRKPRGQGHRVRCHPGAQSRPHPGVDLAVRPHRTARRTRCDRFDRARRRRAAVARRLSRQRAAGDPGRTGDARLGHLRRGRGARGALRAHADRQGPMARCLRAGVRRVRARRRGGRLVDQRPGAAPPRRGRARSRHRRLSLPGRLRQRGGRTARHRAGLHGADAMGRRDGHAGRRRIARAALAGLQVPPVRRRHRAVRRDLRRVLQHRAASRSFTAKGRPGRSRSRR